MYSSLEHKTPLPLLFCLRDMRRGLRHTLPEPNLNLLSSNYLGFCCWPEQINCMNMINTIDIAKYTHVLETLCFTKSTNTDAHKNVSCWIKYCLKQHCKTTTIHNSDYNIQNYCSTHTCQLMHLQHYSKLTSLDNLVNKSPPLRNPRIRYSFPSVWNAEI